MPVDSFDERHGRARRPRARWSTPTAVEKDVTTQVIDVDERVKTTEQSLRRLRAFLAESNDVGELVRLEGEITAREAELQSLKAQQEYLASQTSMATIDAPPLHPEEYVAPPDALEDAGFLAGLKGGWNALRRHRRRRLTVIGAFSPSASRSP